MISQILDSTNLLFDHGNQTLERESIIHYKHFKNPFN